MFCVRFRDGESGKSGCRVWGWRVWDEWVKGLEIERGKEEHVGLI